MNVYTRGVRNAFRNITRTFSLIVILGISIGLALAMLIARQAVTQKINTVKSSVGNTVSISPAGVRGFEGGGNALTTAQISKISGLTHVTAVDKSLSDRLTSTDTNLQTAIEAGSLGQRFSQRSGSTTEQGAGNGAPSEAPTSTGSDSNRSFTPPITVIGTTAPSDLSSTQGGGSFKLTSGKLFDTASTDNVAVVGKSLAAKNNLSVGSTFTAYSTTITVVGIFDAGNTFANNQLIMPLTTVQKLSDQADAITSATATIDSITNVSSATTAIKTALGTSADVTNSAEQAETSIAPLENIKTISLYSLIGAIIAGSIIILLTMIMIVRERRREIGVLKAIGATNAKVMFQFISEAVTLTVLGAVVGIIIGIAAAQPITKLLVSNSSSSTSSETRTAGAGGQPMRSERGFGGGLRTNLTNINAVVNWTIVLDGLGAAIVIAIIGSGAASALITKIRPAEVLRTE